MRKLGSDIIEKRLKTLEEQRRQQEERQQAEQNAGVAVPKTVNDGKTAVPAAEEGVEKVSSEDNKPDAGVEKPDKPVDGTDKHKSAEDLHLEDGVRAEDRGRLGDPFERMVADFKIFSREHPMVVPLNLVFVEQRRGLINVYQGQPGNTWVWLRATGCTFVFKSLLRAILNLADDQPLKQYFKDYSLVTGERTW